MTVCPVALAVGCRKCLVFSVCPLKSVIGDQPTAASGSGSGAKKAAPKKKSKSH